MSDVDAFQPFRIPEESDLWTPDLRLAETAAWRVRDRITEWVYTRLDGPGDVPDIDPTDLTGACAIASYVLWRVLQELGIESTLVRGYYARGPHCWVNLRGVRLDATATQFGIPDLVWVTSIGTDPHYEEFALNEEALEDFAASWRSQSPLSFTSELESMAREIATRLRTRNWAVR